MFVYLKNWFKKLCTKYTEKDFLQFCRTGDLEKLKVLLQNTDVDLNIGLLEATRYGRNNIVEYIVKSGVSISALDESLEIACQNGNITGAEFLVKSGANVMIGLRNCNSPNIYKMLYRYRQKTENF